MLLRLELAHRPQLRDIVPTKRAEPADKRLLLPQGGLKIALVVLLPVQPEMPVKPRDPLLVGLEEGVLCVEDIRKVIKDDLSRVRMSCWWRVVLTGKWEKLMNLWFGDTL